MTGDQLAFPISDETKFDLFHAANPHVYATLVRLARQWVAKTGRHKVGISALYEVARWEIALATTDADFKIDNSHRAYYSRLIMAQEPDLGGLFDLRASKADEWIAGVA
jgi:hypothetical protein